MKTIFILIDDISRSGGTERVASFLANQMSLAGYSVFWFRYPRKMGCLIIRWINGLN